MNLDHLLRGKLRRRPIVESLTPRTIFRRPASFTISEMDQWGMTVGGFAAYHRHDDGLLPRIEDRFGARTCSIVDCMLKSTSLVPLANATDRVKPSEFEVCSKRAKLSSSIDDHRQVKIQDEPSDEISHLKQTHNL